MNTQTTIEYTDRNGVTVQMPAKYTPEFCKARVLGEWFESEDVVRRLAFVKWQYETGRFNADGN